MCPRVQHLSIRAFIRVAKPISQFLLDKTNVNTRQLRFLCFSSAGETWFKQFKHFIESESLLDDYTLKQTGSQLYLWWQCGFLYKIFWLRINKQFYFMDSNSAISHRENIQERAYLFQRFNLATFFRRLILYINVNIKRKMSFIVEYLVNMIFQLTQHYFVIQTTCSVLPFQ